MRVTSLMRCYPMKLIVTRIHTHLMNRLHLHLQIFPHDNENQLTDSPTNVSNQLFRKK